MEECGLAGVDRGSAARGVASVRNVPPRRRSQDWDREGGHNRK